MENENKLDVLREQVTLLDHLVEDIDTYKRDQLARVDSERQLLLRRIRELEAAEDPAAPRGRSPHQRDQEIIRVETVRRIVYQGPRGWVHGTLNRTLKGTIQMPQVADGQDRYIISEEIERHPPTAPDPHIKVDETLEQHHARIADWNPRKQRRQA